MIKVKVAYKVKSKAKRVYIFKPKEVVQEEKFDLEIKFQNLGEQFNGGSCRLVLHYPDSTDPMECIEIPRLNENESMTKTVEDLVMITSGNCGFELHEQRYKTRDDIEHSELFLFDERNNLIEEDYFLTIPVSSKEEIYQKYSLVIALVALLVSFVALFSSITDLLVRLITS